MVGLYQKGPSLPPGHFTQLFSRQLQEQRQFPAGIRLLTKPEKGLATTYKDQCLFAQTLQMNLLQQNSFFLLPQFRPVCGNRSAGLLIFCSPMQRTRCLSFFAVRVQARAQQQSPSRGCLQLEGPGQSASEPQSVPEAPGGSAVLHKMSSPGAGGRATL